MQTGSGSESTAASKVWLWTLRRVPSHPGRISGWKVGFAVLPLALSSHREVGLSSLEWFACLLTGPVVFFVLPLLPLLVLDTAASTAF